MTDAFSGSMRFTVVYDTLPPTITIDQADPHVLFSDEALRQAHNRNPYLRLDPPPAGGVATSWTGWLLHIDIPGRHLIYRIGEYRLAQHVWEASWPD